MNTSPSENIPNISNLPITYAGITAECIPWTENIYEVVWNCGSLAWLMITLEDEILKNSVIAMIARILESLRSTNAEIIFVLDAGILEGQKILLTSLFSSIFWAWKFALIGVVTTAQDTNPINWLRVNRTDFVDREILIRAIEDMPDATVVSSIPRSDPRIHSLNTTLKSKNLLQTFASRSLQLLDLNSRKENQISIAGESIGFLGMAKSREDLEVLFARFSGERLVVKESSGSAGGTNVNFVGQRDQESAFLKNATNFPLLVFRFIEPTTVLGTSGGVFPIQFRPFLTSGGEFSGGCLKIPTEPLQGDGFSLGSWKESFKRQNRTLNTSSWLCNSFFFDFQGEPITWQIIENGWFRTIGWGDMWKFLGLFRLVKWEKFVSWNEIIAMTESMFPVIRTIQVRTNQALNLISIC